MSHLRAVLPFFRPYRGKLAWGLLLVAVTNLFQTASPYLIKLGVDSLSHPDVTVGLIASYAGLLVLAAVLGGAARYGMRELLNGISRRMECDLRNEFLRQLLRLDAPFYSNNRTGDLMTRASQDTLAVRMAVGPAVMYAANTAIGFSLALTLMLWISPRLTLLALIPMLLLPPIVLGFGRVIHRRFEKIQEQFSSVSTMVQENLTGVRIVRAYVQEDDQASRFEALNREYMERNMSLVRASGLLHPILGLLSGVGLIVVLWVGGLEIIAGRITVGDFVAFNIYLALLIWPLIALGWVVNLFQRGDASMGRLRRILEHEPDVASPERPAPPPSAPPEIRFEGVRFRYPGTERWVLDGIDLTVEAGQTVAVVGPTGSGKSTLVSLIPRLFDPTEGRILMDRQPLDRLPLEDVRRRIGMVPQDTFLFTDTIRANIGLGLEPGPGFDAAVEAAARVAHLAETITEFPRGYETELGERGINLSGGQKQRAALARALARDPWILILDDALSAVDTHTESSILAELRGARAGRTAFIISHRVSAVMDADLILVLQDGRAVERGTHAELLAQQGVYASLLRRQMLAQEIEGVGAG